MWIVTHDGKHLVDAKHFSIEKNLGSKEKKFAVCAHLNDSQTVTGTVVCAYYPSEQSAFSDLMRLKEAIEAKSDKVFQFTD